MLSETEVNKYAARQLRALRTTSGISQTRLARELRMSPQQVQKYEWGLNRMSVGKLMQFAEAFDVPVNIFFPERDRHYSYEPVPPPTMRFIRLIGRIDPKHYDQLYAALKVIVNLAREDA